MDLNQDGHDPEFSSKTPPADAAGSRIPVLRRDRLLRLPSLELGL
jgi:hypothetical protein